jgi:hypothetical protein
MSATWLWTRGDHYNEARGIPKIEVGVVGKGCVNVPFTGVVTMNLMPRRFWRRVLLNGTEKAFLIQFKPQSLGLGDDLSATVDDFEASIQRKVSVRSSAAASYLDRGPLTCERWRPQ